MKGRKTFSFNRSIQRWKKRNQKFEIKSKRFVDPMMAAAVVLMVFGSNEISLRRNDIFSAWDTSTTGESSFFFLSRISFSLIWRLFKMHEHSSAPSNLRNWFDTYLQIIYTYTRVKLRAPTLNRTSIGVKHELALARSLTSRQTNCIKAWESLSLSVTLSIFDTPSVNAGAWGKLRLENYTKNAIDIDSMWTGKSEQSSRKKQCTSKEKK